VGGKRSPNSLASEVTSVGWCSIEVLLETEIKKERKKERKKESGVLEGNYAELKRVKVVI
jgi:hypothetical protein